MKPDKFTDLRTVTFTKYFKTFIIEKSFEYYRKDRTQPSIIVPKGFESDGFTTGFFRFLIPNISIGASCAILHDFLCEKFHKGECSRAFADEVFYEALLETQGVSKFRAKILYLAVRLFALIKGYK